MSDIEDEKKLLETAKENEEWMNQMTGKIKEVITSTDSSMNAFSLNIKKVFGEINNTFSKLGDAINPLDSQAFADMDLYSNTIQRTFGLAKNRMDEFKNTIADSGPALVKMGLDESQVVTNLNTIMQSLGTSASLTEEAVVGVTAAAEASGQDVGTLARSFREVGVSVYDVGDEMKKVVNYARSVGVSVSQVSSLVVSNLSQLNMFNFDNGVTGLAKMAATSERLGISMSTVFTQAENLMSPENAINLAAGLQRLGVASSELLDPLRAMDMAQNDPEALQKAMVKLGQEFTTFNEKTGKMEILPGAKRRMREVAKEAGILPEEFSKMALKAADFEMKLKQIKMPDIVGGNQETKELIASMAQMKDGVATIKVKDSETGEIKEKAVEQLTPDDITELQKANEESSKSLEDIAINQLDETKQIKSLIDSGVVSAKFAKATNPTLSKFYGQVAASYKEVARGTAAVIGNTKEQRTKQESVYGPMKDLIVSSVTGDDKTKQEAEKALETQFFKLVGDMDAKFKEQVDKVQEKLISNFKEEYLKTNDKNIKTEHTYTVNVKVEGDANTGKMDKAQITDAVIQGITDPIKASEMNANLNPKNAPSASTGTK